MKGWILKMWGIKLIMSPGIARGSRTYQAQEGVGILEIGDEDCRTVVRMEVVERDCSKEQ